MSARRSALQIANGTHIILRQPAPVAVPGEKPHEPPHQPIRAGSVLAPLPRRSIPSFTSLLAFEAAARHLSFSQAAKEMSLTQAAVSKQIGRLESLLGVSLFERTRRHVVLTYEGHTYLQEVRDLIQRLEHSTHSMLAGARSATELNLAVLPSFATRWLLPRLPRFKQREAHVVVNLATRLVPFAFEQERFDAAIHYGSADWPGAISRHLFDEMVVAVASPDYCAQIGLRRPADLARATLIQQATRPSLWHDWLDQLGTELKHAYSGPMTDQFNIAIESAAAGLGVALAPDFLVDDEIRSGRLVALFDHRVRGQHGYYLVSPTGKFHHPAVMAFREWLGTECARYRDGRPS